MPNTLLPTPWIFKHAVDPAFSLFHSVITNTNWLSVNCPTNTPLFYVSVLTSLSVIVKCYETCVRQLEIIVEIIL